MVKSYQIMILDILNVINMKYYYVERTKSIAQKNISHYKTANQNPPKTFQKLLANEVNRKKYVYILFLHLV